MLCEKCKIREATIQYTEIINGIPENHSFCAQCAAEYLPNIMGKYAPFAEGEMPLTKLLSSLLAAQTGKQGDPQRENIECPTCHTTYKEFVENSKFGCPDCYEVFDLLIGENIKQLQGSDTHRGKVPKNITKILPGGVDSDLNIKKENIDRNKLETVNSLKRRLKEAVAKEEYEEAARLRDEIKRIEEGEEHE